MSLERILQNLVVKVPQVFGAILIDQEGETVSESCQGEPFDLRVLAAHCGIILTRLREMQTSGDTGEIHDALVTSRDGYIIFGPVDREYALVMHMGREGVVTQALYQFRQAICELKRGF